MDRNNSKYNNKAFTEWNVMWTCLVNTLGCVPQAHVYSNRHPPKLSETDTHYAQYLITSRKAENATQITQILQQVINRSLTSQTTRNHLKRAGLKAVVEAKRPLLTKRHRKERLDFALAYQDWTVEDWKTVIWSDETKINRLGSDGRVWG